MESYVDYDFYINQYNGSLSNDLFNSLIVRASREIDSNVNKDLTSEVINSLTNKEKYLLKYATSMMIDFLNKNDIVISSNSVSIDGVSIGQSNRNEIITNKKEVLKYLPESLTRYI